jgi:hypothetical protein
MEFYSAIKKELNYALCRKMDETEELHVKQSKPDSRS